MLFKLLLKFAQVFKMLILTVRDIFSFKYHKIYSPPVRLTGQFLDMGLDRKTACNFDFRKLKDIGK